MQGSKGGLLLILTVDVLPWYRHAHGPDGIYIYIYIYLHF